MTVTTQKNLNTTVIGAAVVGLPLLGARLAGHPVGEFLRFPPPLEIPTGYPLFSWWMAALVVGLVLAILAPWIKRSWHGYRAGHSVLPTKTATPAFPIWGWIAMLWTLAWWFLAWTRQPWFSALQPYTFFPLWLGFIVTVNAAVQRRTGTCLMRRAPARWWRLFVTSAGCWWLFEWLNRFVHNWHYLGAENFGALGYFVHATFCFSTVLPAVAAVAEWLSAYPALQRSLANGPAWSLLERRPLAVALCLIGVVGLVGTGAFPRAFYPALWIAPLALLLAEPVLARRPDITREIGRGDWQRAGTWMLAALICGFFWEMWNWQSMPKWIYTVPAAERWHVFEMPLLGYVGYLPFGLECLFVVSKTVGDER